MNIWDKLKTVPKEHLKQIEAGRLKGKWSIEPQWRLQVLTETFGPIGDGWRFMVEKFWTEQGAGGEVVAFAHIKLSYMNEGEWSNNVEGIGSSLLIANESKGAHTNPECFKMALTDAISVAAKQLGVGSDIYMGMWDGASYVHDTLSRHDDKLSPEQIEELEKAIADSGSNLTKLLKACQAKCVADIKLSQIGIVQSLIAAKKEKQ